MAAEIWRLFASQLGGNNNVQSSWPWNCFFICSFYLLLIDGSTGSFWKFSNSLHLLKPPFLSVAHRIFVLGCFVLPQLFENFALFILFLFSQLFFSLMLFTRFKFNNLFLRCFVLKSFYFICNMICIVEYKHFDDHLQ